MNQPKFAVGRTVATPGALEVLERHKQNPIVLLARHITGDWGDVCAQDKRSNDRALDPKDPQRVLSVYKLDNVDTVWIITEWDRSVTTLLLPSEY